MTDTQIPSTRRDAPGVRTVRSVVVRASDLEPAGVIGEGFHGVTQTLLIGEQQTSVHQEVVVTELAAGGTIPGHFHPFEESFFLLEGVAIFAVDGLAYELHPGDFGFAPVGAPHAWRNLTDTACRWLEFRVPQPKVVGDARGTYAHPALSAPRSGRRAVINDPTSRYVDHFELDQMSPYGPIAGKGVVNYCIRHISTRLLVSEAMGATQHVTFMAQLPPAPADALTVRDLMETDPLTKCHYHQYEEVYHFLEGHGLAYLDGQTHEVRAGDTILAGVGSSHAVVNISDAPLRWLETQSPCPPAQHGVFWEKEWSRLDPIELSIR